MFKYSGSGAGVSPAELGVWPSLQGSWVERPMDRRDACPTT